MRSNGIKACTLRNVKRVDVKRYQRIAKSTSALANGTRIAILHIITENDEVCTCELESALGIPQPSITVHMHKLNDAGLLEKREEWRYTYYSIAPRYNDLTRSVLDNK